MESVLWLGEVSIAELLESVSTERRDSLDF